MEDVEEVQNMIPMKRKRRERGEEITNNIGHGGKLVRSGTGAPRRDMRETKKKNEFTGKLRYLVSAEGNAKSRTRQRAQARPALSLERSSSAAACAAQGDINATHIIIIMLLCLARRHSWATLRGRRENSGANQNRNAQSESVGSWAERP